MYTLHLGVGGSPEEIKVTIPARSYNEAFEIAKESVTEHHIWLKSVWFDENLEKLRNH